MVTDPGDECIQLLTLAGIVQTVRRQESVLQLCSQAVPLDQVEVLLRAPNQVPAAFSHLPGDGISHRRTSPIGDNRHADLPCCVFVGRGRCGGNGNDKDNDNPRCFFTTPEPRSEVFEKETSGIESPTLARKDRRLHRHFVTYIVHFQSLV
jgi:hypothetical protein